MKSTKLILVAVSALAFVANVPSAIAKSHPIDTNEDAADATRAVIAMDARHSLNSRALLHSSNEMDVAHFVIASGVTNSVTASATSESANAPDPSTATIYQDMRQLWENNNRIKSTTIDLLGEGRNAPARRKWTDYDLTVLQDDLAGLKTYSDNLSIPSSQATALAEPWAQCKSKIAKMTELVAKLNAELQTVKSPTDDSYPPHFWKPASEVSTAAQDLDTAILSVFSILDAGVAQGNPSSSSAISNATAQAHAATSAATAPLQGYAKAIPADNDIKQIDEASKRIGKACWGLFGELERWNLLYGQPPAGGIGNGFYGGGLTAKEVTTEYKYLPQFTFTNAPYVMLYSYRLPPRQNMLAYHTGQVGKLLNLMESDMNDIQIPADRKDALAGPWEDAKRLFLDCRNKYLALYTAVNNTNDDRLKKNIREDQATIGQPVMDIYGDVSKLQGALSDMEKLLK